MASVAPRAHGRASRVVALRRAGPHEAQTRHWRMTAAPLPLPAPPPGFRRHALDGAMLYFEPRTGTHVRLTSAATQALRRTAPRVVMFGVTNACNLRCAFCSRDVPAPSAWTVDSAAAVLEELAAAGVLEVAFGGGEPLAFGGLAELVTRLRARTPLAMHVTTNGTLVTEARWRSLGDAIGIARLSIYEGIDWRAAPRVWRALGQRWGANVLVDDAALAGLPALLTELAAAGAFDVSILTYVEHPGAATHQLGAAARARVAAIIDDAPLPCRLSVCAGDRLGVARLWHGADGSGDCGAGLDFVTVTPDQRLQACSFAPSMLPARTAAEILSGWRARQDALAAPSERAGCARALPLLDRVAAPPPAPPLAIWRSFAGNNSGECVMVARFATAAAADALLADLLPGWRAGEGWTHAWLELARAAQVATPTLTETGTTWVEMPHQLEAIGSSLIALGYDADDQFHELRHLAWRRGAAAVDGRVHAHEPLALLAAIRGDDAGDVAALAAAARAAPGVRAWRHGHDLLLAAPLDGEDTLAARKAWLVGLVGPRPLAADVIERPTDDELTAVLQRLGATPAAAPRMHLTFHGDDRDQQAAALARTLRRGDHAGAPSSAKVHWAGDRLIVDDVTRPRRLAVLAARAGAHAHVTHGRRGVLRGTIWVMQPPPQRGARPPRVALDVETLRRQLAASPALARAALSIPERRTDVATVTLETDAPGPAWVALHAAAIAIGARAHAGFADDAPLGWTVRALLAALG